MILSVRGAKYIHDYIIDITFSTNETKRVDFSRYIQTQKWIFSPLQDLVFFQDFSIDTTIVWKNGADIAPDRLYQDGELITSR